MRTRLALISCGMLVVALAQGCSGAHVGRPARLDQASALALAVDLANAECAKLYSAKPFNSESFAIVFLGDRWHWGEIDPAGPRGYSGTVSFDAFGEERRVQIVLQVDKPEYR